MSPLPPVPALARTRPSRVAVLLLTIPVIAMVWGGDPNPLYALPPHVLYRVPLALVAAWGLWRCRRWAYLLVFINAAVWLLTFLFVVPLLLEYPPWELWVQWLNWLVPTVLVVAACVLMMSAAGRAERARWVREG